MGSIDVMAEMWVLGCDNIGGVRILGGDLGLEYKGGPRGGQIASRHDVVLTSVRRNDVASTSFRRHVPSRFLINQC